MKGNWTQACLNYGDILWASYFSPIFFMYEKWLFSKVKLLPTIAQISVTYVSHSGFVYETSVHNLPLPPSNLTYFKGFTLLSVWHLHKPPGFFSYTTFHKWNGLLEFPCSVKSWCSFLWLRILLKVENPHVVKMISFCPTVCVLPSYCTSNELNTANIALACHSVCSNISLGYWLFITLMSSISQPSSLIVTPCIGWYLSPPVDTVLLRLFVRVFIS